MTPSGQGTHVPARPATAATHAHRPVHASPAPVRQPEHAAGEAGEGVVGRLEGVRARLSAMLPLLQDEGGRHLSAALRELDAVLAELRTNTAGSVRGSGPGAAVASATSGTGAEPPAPARPWRALPPGAGAQTTAAPAAVGRHRPPPLPCGPDYVVLPARRER